MANAADLNRWGDSAATIAAGQCARITLASRLDRIHRAGVHHLVADRPRTSRLHAREQEHGLLGSQPFRQQDGTDAVEDGADARQHGKQRLRLRRRPRAAIAPSTNIASRRCAGWRKSSASSRLPGAAAPRQGQGRVRPVHGPASSAPGLAERRPAAGLTPLSIDELFPARLPATGRFRLSAGSASRFATSSRGRCQFHRRVKLR